MASCYLKVYTHTVIVWISFAMQELVATKQNIIFFWVIPHSRNACRYRERSCLVPPKKASMQALGKQCNRTNTLTCVHTCVHTKMRYVKSLSFVLICVRYKQLDWYAQVCTYIHTCRLRHDARTYTPNATTTNNRVICSAISDMFMLRNKQLPQLSYQTHWS